MEFVLLFLRTFYFLIAAFSVASSYRIREVVPVRKAHGTLQLLQLLKHFTHGFLHCHVLSFLCSLCGIINHETFVPKTRGSACLVCLLMVLQHRSDTGKVRVLGYLLQWRSVGTEGMKSQR